MRRRIVIGLLAVMVIGVVAFFVSQPKRGSLEWHKRKYIAAWKRMYDPTLPAKAKAWLWRIAGRKTPGPVFGGDERIQSHRAALLALGYLGQQSFEFTNCSRGQVASTPAFASAMRRARPEFLLVIAHSSNGLHIIAVAEDLPLFTEAVHKAEVPKSGK